MMAVGEGDTQEVELGLQIFPELAEERGLENDEGGDTDTVRDDDQINDDLGGDDREDQDSSAEQIGEDPGIPSVLLNQARGMGFTDNDIQALGAQRVADFVTQRQRELLASQMQSTQAAPQGQGGTVEAKEPDLSDFEEISLGNPEDFDEETLKFAKQVNERLKGLHGQLAKFKQMEAQFSQYQQRVQQEEIERQNRFLDEQFGRVADDYGEVLGKGSIQEITHAEFAARQAVAHTMMQLRLMEPTMKPEDAFEKALLINHADIAASRREQKLRDGIQKQSGKRVGAPANKRAAERKDLDKLPPDHPDVVRHWERVLAEG